ncbi:DUF1885 family protein [Litchfieldia salsa]|uniref:DUF1885 family protein n=1 Tax=Litchfieldia salsa TaxID=930152 RepID=A0A1H0RIY7_9BACI|nr:DUF1885 family protein [Litchfieldia salsa]SDP29532.1 protein of unknown function [Litchfieldia salsa]
MINAYIKLVAGSVTQEVTLDDVKDLLHYYQEITSKTGSQLDWDYSEHAFPYKITKEQEDYFVLESKDSRYRSIIIGVGKELSGGNTQAYIQVSLPQQSTHGDKGKANEFCKFLGKKFEGELHMFNGRVMYYYKRK